MITITIEEARARLSELIDALSPGEVVAITRNNHPVARLMIERPTQAPRTPGNCKGKLTIVSDYDDHLYDWAEHTA